MDGFQVMPLAERRRGGHRDHTVTGNLNVIDSQHVKAFKDGAIICNSGHFNDEINIPSIEEQSLGKRRVRDFVDEYQMPGGRRIYLLGEGRLINLAAAEGHPAAVMDMSFANQRSGLSNIVKQGKALKNEVLQRPRGHRPRDRAPEA